MEKNDLNNELSDKINALIKDYRDEYNKDKHPFLLYELAHVKENDHTRVLKSILTFNNYQFLFSFLDRIGVRYSSEGTKDINISDQENALGNDGTGSIDLLIKLGEETVIIENKICGAPDGERQLARYIATACGIGVKEKDKFSTIWNSWEKGNPSDLITVDKLKNIHVIYLTADGNKTPGKNSLPDYFRNSDDSDDSEFKIINYYPVNYAYDIIPWLEYDVLPNVPFLDDGIMIAGIRQYIASLKDRYIPLESSKCVKDIVDEIKNKETKPLEQYKIIKNVIKELNIKLEDPNSKDNDLIGKIQGELNENMKYLFPAPKGWELYFTTSFILMYKDEWWSEYDKKKNCNFPAIHLFCSPTDNFIKSKGNLSWVIKGVRIPQSSIVGSNHSKSNWKIVKSDLVKKLYSIKIDSYSENFFNKVLEKSDVKDAIDFIDNKVIPYAKEQKISYQVALIEKTMNEK